MIIWGSMVNGLAITESAHKDVHFAILAEAYTRSMDEVKEIADLQFGRTEYLNELNLEFFRFDVRYDLKMQIISELLSYVVRI